MSILSVAVMVLRWLLQLAVDISTVKIVKLLLDRGAVTPTSRDVDLYGTAPVVQAIVYHKRRIVRKVVITDSSLKDLGRGYQFLSLTYPKVATPMSSEVRAE